MPPRKAPKERGALPPSRKKKNTPHHGANTAGHPNPPVRDPSEEEAKEGSPSPSASSSSPSHHFVIKRQGADDEIGCHH